MFLTYYSNEHHEDISYYVSPAAKHNDTIVGYGMDSGLAYYITLSAANEVVEVEVA